MFCTVVSLLAQSFPHDRWPRDLPQVGPVESLPQPQEMKWNMPLHFGHTYCLDKSELVFLDIDRNDQLSSAPTHQSLEVYPHVLANFDVHKNHETTVRSKI